MGDTLAALDDRPFMDALLNVVLPASPSGDIPAAGTLDLSSAVAAGVREDPLLGPAVGPGLEALRSDANEHGGLAAMSHDDATALVKERFLANPVLMMGLLRHLYPAYYAHPGVLPGIGEPGRPPFPEGFEVESTNPELIEVLQTRRKRA